MENLPKLRQELALTMKEYCQHTLSIIDREIMKLYDKYHVSSRSELTEDQLKECIKSYRAGIIYDEINPIELEYKKLSDQYNKRKKESGKSTGMQAVVQLFLDYPDKVWWWSYEIIGKVNSKNEFISHRGPARASDLAIYHSDIVEDRKIGRLAIYRLKRENIKEVEKFLKQ